MTKAELVNKIAKSTGVEKQQTAQIIEGFMASVKDSVLRGESVYLRGFGTFLSKHRAVKTARNISKNTTVIVPAHNIPAFKPSKEFANAVKGK